MTEELKELSLKRDENEKLTDPVKRTPFAEIDAALQRAFELASEKKAFDMIGLDLRGIAGFTDYFMICSGANSKQVQAISDEIDEKLRKESLSKPLRIEGYNSAEWILMDFGDFVVHIFDKEIRTQFELERLWHDAVKIEIPETLL